MSYEELSQKLFKVEEYSADRKSGNETSRREESGCDGAIWKKTKLTISNKVIIMTYIKEDRTKPIQI